MKAIILAAGKGSRLGKFNNNMPKSMLEFNNKSIIQHQIQICQAIGIKHFVVVIGYKQQILKQHILSFLNKTNCTFVENEKFDSTNTLYSLWLTTKYFDEDFIYFNADVLFAESLLKKIITEPAKSQLLIEQKQCGEEEVKVVLDENNCITEIGKKINPAICAGEFIGIGRFAKSVLSSFKLALNKGIEEKMHNNYFEYAVNILCKTEKLNAVFTAGIPCIEIDFYEDLIKAKIMDFK